MKIDFHIRRNRTKRLFYGILLCAIMLVSTFSHEPLYAADKDNTNVTAGRIINVVYDDSGSMVRSGGKIYIPRWSQAKYSLEVFAAMLGSADEMNIYPMSLEGGLGYTLTGKDANRVKTVHEMNARYHNTPFSTVKAAAKHLLSDKSGKEKWLVIITDGEFDDGRSSVEVVTSTINSYLENGIKVIFLGIGDDVTPPQGNPAKSFYTEKAADGLDVLTKVTNIANLIFSHLVLPTSNISQNGKKYKLSFDIPTDQIIVFAQGDDVSIGKLIRDSETMSPSDIENVKYSDVLPLNYPDAVTDTTLKGVVATYNAGFEPFPDGDFEIQVSGAETVEFYYKPGVVVNADLKSSKGIVRKDDILYAGDYEVTMNFVNPLTEQPVKSKLLDGAVFNLEVKNAGNTYTLESDSGIIGLEEGEVVLNATALLPGQVVLRDQKRYDAIPEPLILNLNVSSEKNTFVSREIAEGIVDPFVLTVKKEKTGEKLTKEEWKATEITLNNGYGIDWKLEKGDEVSTWTMKPLSSDGTFGSIQAGELTYNVSAEYKIGKQDAYGSTTFSLNIEAYAGSALIVKADTNQKAYSMDNLESEGGIKVSILYEDDATHELLPLTETMKENLQFEAALQEDKNLKLLVEPIENSDDYMIYPRYYTDALKTDKGNYNIVCKASTFEGEKNFAGSDQVSISIDSISFGKWLELMAIKLLIIGLILFILFGYIKKNRIKKKKLNPHNVNAARHRSPKRPINKKLLTVLLPYKSEEAVVKSNNTNFDCPFPNLVIKAVSNNSFKIINKNIDVRRIVINGNRYDDVKQIKQETFSYSMFEMVSTEKRGRFLFN